MTDNPEIHRRRSLRLKGYDYTQAGAYFVTITIQGRLCLFGEVVSEEMRLNEAGVMAYKVWAALPHRFPVIEIDAFVVMPNHLHGIIIINQPVGASLVDAQSCDDKSIVGASLVDAQSCDNKSIVGASLVDAQSCDNKSIVGASLVDAQSCDDKSIVGASLVDAQSRDDKSIVGASLVDAQSRDDKSIVGASLVDAQSRDDKSIVGASLVDTPTEGNQGTNRFALGDVVGAYKSLTTVEYVRGVKTMKWPPFHGRLWQRNYYEHIVRHNESLEGIQQYILNNPGQWAFDKENPLTKRSETEKL